MEEKQCDGGFKSGQDGFYCTVVPVNLCSTLKFDSVKICDVFNTGRPNTLVNT